MKKVDFLFSYEVKARELESVCLIKQELERRGYSTAVLNTWNAINSKPMDCLAEVMVMSACYRTSTYTAFTNNVRHFHKAVNLQWEQIRSVKVETSPPHGDKSNYYFSGKSKDVVHISWGPKNYEHLTKTCGIPEKNVIMTGHPALDFLRPGLVDYFMSREELFGRYGIPAEKKVCLFISSFAIIGRPSSEIDVDKSFGESNIDVNLEVATKSQHEVLEWFKKAMDETDTVFVYRPHPTEANNPELSAMAEKYSNFFVIKDESVRQWILACDVIYNWNSTSLAEIHMCRKSCYMLRPVELPDSFNSSIFRDVKGITTVEKFMESLRNTAPAFPISEELFRYYYYIPEEKYTYQLICDALERIYRDNAYKINGFREYTERNKTVRRFWDDLASSKLGSAIAGLNGPLTKKFSSKINARRELWSNPEKDMSDYSKEMRHLYYASPEEIENMCRRLRELTSGIVCDN